MQSAVWQCVRFHTSNICLDNAGRSIMGYGLFAKFASGQGGHSVVLVTIVYMKPGTPGFIVARMYSWYTRIYGFQ